MEMKNKRIKPSTILSSFEKSKYFRPQALTMLEYIRDLAEYLDTIDVVDLKTSLNNEITDRTNADTTLQEHIDTETQNRQQADNSLQQNIDAEINRSELAESELQHDIDNHTNNFSNPHKTTLSNVVEEVTLWENTAIENPFVAQTIALNDNIDNYKEIKIIFKQYNYYNSTSIKIDGTNKIYVPNIAFLGLYDSESGLSIITRSMSIQNSIANIKRGCYFAISIAGKTITDAEVSESIMIPYKIIGIKDKTFSNKGGK